MQKSGILIFYDFPEGIPLYSRYLKFSDENIPPYPYIHFGEAEN